MKTIDVRMLHSIVNQYQIDSHNRQPVQYVYVHNRFYKEEGDIFGVKMGRLPGVLSIVTDWDTTSVAGTFSITCENEDGQLTPDYHRNKTDINQGLRGHYDSPWKHQLMPNTVIEIHWGYGDYTVQDMTGEIDTVSVDAENQTITITGRSMYKRAMENTITPYTNSPYILPLRTTKMVDALNRLLTYAKLNFIPMPIKDEQTGEDYAIGGAMGMRGDTYEEIITPLMDSIPFVLQEQPNGDIKLMKLPRFMQEDKALFTFDDYTHINQTEYELDDREKYGTLIVKGGEIMSFYDSTYIYRRILRGHRRELRLDVPHANTAWKRKMAAQSHFIKQLHNWRKLTIGVPANPALQTWDVVRVHERISTAQWNYHVTSINTKFDSSGFYQVLELSSNFGYAQELPPPPPPPTSDLPTYVAKDSSLSIMYADYGAPDGDIINLYLNGDKILNLHMLTEPFEETSLNLKKGDNILIIEGVSAGQSDNLTLSVNLKDKNGQLVYPDHLIVDFPRSNVDGQSGFYKGKKPRKTWIIRGDFDE